MMEKINLLDINCCQLPNCDCGSNLSLGLRCEDMPKLMKLLYNNFKIQSNLQPTKILGATQETEFELAQCLGCGVLIMNDGEHDCKECSIKFNRENNENYKIS